MNYLSDCACFRTVDELFSIFDDHHDKQLLELKDYLHKSKEEHREYNESAQKSMDKMGDEYEYHNWDYGIEQELCLEAIAAEIMVEHCKDIKEFQLMSLYEMKVLYLAKEIEIRLKKILFKKYQADMSELGNFGKIVAEFKSNNICLNSISGIKGINNLRSVANDLKHSIKIINALKIIEFKGLSEFNSASMEKFMSGRVHVVETYFQKLIKEVNNVTEEPFVPSVDGIPF